MFLYDRLMPNGAQCALHKAIRFEVKEDGTHAVVNSYHSEAMEIISWQDTYVIPPVLLVTSLADVEIILTLPDAPFDGGTILPDDDATLETAKARAKARVKIARDRAEWAGIETDLGPVDTDPSSQRKVLGLVAIAMLQGQNFSVNFRFADDTEAVLDDGQMKIVGLAVGAHVDAMQQIKNGLDADIDAAEDPETALAVVWPD